jgi:hypothetical protein
MAVSTRLQALEQLSQKLRPTSKGQQAARDIQLQQAVAASRGQPQTAQTSGAIGTAAAATRTQQASAGIEGAMKQQGQIAQMGSQQQQHEMGMSQQQGQLALRNESLTGQQRLDRLGRETRREILDSRMQFEQDQAGQALLNDSQLLDYAVMSGKSKQQLADYQQTAEQSHARKSQLMERAHQVVSDALKRGYISKGKQLDQESKRQLLEMKQYAEKQARDKQNAAANRNAMFTAGGTLIGAVAGGMIGSVAGPAGIAAGASLGASLGGGAGSALGGTSI